MRKSNALAMIDRDRQSADRVPAFNLRGAAEALQAEVLQAEVLQPVQPGPDTQIANPRSYLSRDELETYLASTKT